MPSGPLLSTGTLACASRTSISRALPVMEAISARLRSKSASWPARTTIMAGASCASATSLKPAGGARKNSPLARVSRRTGRLPMPKW